MFKKSSAFKFKHLHAALALLAVAGLSFATVGCETDEDNKLADAQECLDNLKDSDADAAAQACAAKVNGINSSQAYVIRCSVDFFVGGIKSSDMIAAFDAYNNASADEKAAVLMAALSQDTEAEAIQTQDSCKKSGVASLIYVSTISLTGTMMTISAGSSVPATFLATCSNGGAGGNCDDAVIGSAIQTMHSAYCVGDAAQSQTCIEVASAIAGGGGDPAQIAIQLYQLLQ